MDILVDENIPLISVDQLRRMGHDVLDIRGTYANTTHTQRISTET